MNSGKDKGGRGQFPQRLGRYAAWRTVQARRHARDFWGNLVHALTGPARRKLHAGRIARTDRIAVYTIFPTSGVLDSHFLALQALSAAGYAPLVVSNLPLTVSARDRLRAHCWKLMERPNFGYDFGAYRDAVRHISDDLPRLRRLVLMNDSVWFPLPGGEDWLTRSEAMDADLVGAVDNLAVAPVAIADWRDQGWKHDASAPEFHYCSFALSFGPKALRSAAFQRFWRRLWLTDDKLHTVRRGEVGLSRALIRAGLSHCATLDLRTFDRELDAMSEIDLAGLVTDLIIPEEPELEQFRRHILSAIPEMPADERAPALRNAALTIIARTGPAYALQAYAQTRHDYPYLKKSPLRLAPQAARTTLALTAALEGEAGAMIHREAMAIHRSRPVNRPPHTDFITAKGS